jgi:hypothetical protein
VRDRRIEGQMRRPLIPKLKPLRSDGFSRW